VFWIYGHVDEDKEEPPLYELGPGRVIQLPRFLREVHIPPGGGVIRLYKVVIINASIGNIDFTTEPFEYDESKETLVINAPIDQRINYLLVTAFQASVSRMQDALVWMTWPK